MQRRRSAPLPIPPPGPPPPPRRTVVERVLPWVDLVYKLVAGLAAAAMLARMLS